MKRIFCILLSVICAFTCFSCGGEDVDVEYLQAEIERLEKEKEELIQQIIGMQQGGGPVEDNTEEEEETKEPPKPQTVAMKTPFQVGELMTVTFNSSEWCEAIHPSVSDVAHSYVADRPGEKFFLIRGTLKNTASKALNVQYSGKAELLINGKYTIKVSMALENVDGKSFNGSATPLQTLPLIIYASVSDELYKEWESAKLSLKLLTDDEKVGFNFQEGFDHAAFEISFSK